MAYSLDVNVPKVVVIGVTSVILLVILCLIGHAYYLWADQREFARKNYGYVNPELVALKGEYAKNLHAYRWIDPARRTAQIPIEDAIKIMAQRKGNPPTTQPLGRPAGS